MTYQNMLGTSSPAHDSLKPRGSRKLMHRNDLLAVQSSLPFFLIGSDTVTHSVFISTHLQSSFLCPLPCTYVLAGTFRGLPFKIFWSRARGPWTPGTEFLLQRWLPWPWQAYHLFLSFSPVVSFVSSSFSLLYFSLHQQGETGNPSELSRLYNWIMTAPTPWV